MADYIPFEIQAEILKRLPVKSLIRFRTVSKSWKSLIRSSDFIASYKFRHTQPRHLFISYVDHIPSGSAKLKFVSVVDDDTFPQQKFSPVVPLSVSLLNNPRVIGSSQGLICLCSYKGKTSVYENVVLWNPLIGKSVVINVPNVLAYPNRTVVGFAVCPHTNDPKLVKTSFTQSASKFEDHIPWQVEVYSLSSGVWRTPSMNLPRKSIALTGNQQVINGFIYWLSINWTTVRKRSGIVSRKIVYLIMSFDITSEKFTKIDILPERLPKEPNIFLTLSKLRESLVLIGYDTESDRDFRKYKVWMMEPGVQKSFTKLFTIYPPGRPIKKVIAGFRNSGKPLIGLLNDFNDDDDDDDFNDDFNDDDDDSDYDYLELERNHSALFIYDPYSSQHMSNTGILGDIYSFSVSSYIHSLLLLDH